MGRLLALVPLGLMVGCLASNPKYDPSASGDATSSGSHGVASAGSSSEGVGVGSTSGADSVSGSGATSSGIEQTSSGTGALSGATTSSSSSSTGRTISSSSTGNADTGVALDPADLGQACGNDKDCSALGVNAECCEADQCAETCMVPCGSVEDCPFDTMGCEHGYCLFPCTLDKGDCAPWPGFTCQHADPNYCENDEAD
ncbi:MAG: hypothetical protein KUG77_09080 [Nannocystaceae bacterium]|nr:hypothetical protein [Nannocystaceae bacterium]